MKVRLGSDYGIRLNTQQGRQRLPIGKTIRSPLPPNFSRHYVLSGETQRRAFALVLESRNENINK